MIKFWYDMATLSYRYIETYPAYGGGDMAVLGNDGTTHIVQKSIALDLAKFSRIVQEPQDLLDALIAAGFKPNKMEGTPGHVAALERHIAFAESIVARVLPVRK